MSRKITMPSIFIAMLLIFSMLTPCLGQSRKGFSVPREQVLRELNLPPDKAKAFMAVGEHWDQVRENIIAGIKGKETGLETALAAPQPDDSKVDQSVNALIAAHDQLFDTFKSQRQEEMALLTPVQRGRFLLALKKWHEEQCAAGTPKP